MILLVTGSRALCHSWASLEWAQQQLYRACHTADLVVTGDARGADHEALIRAPIAHVWRLNGRVDRVVAHGSFTALPPWCTDPLPTTRAEWSRRALARNRAMVAWVAAQPGDRACLALVAPWSRTRGTRYTVGLARAAGILVDGRTCPSEYGPKEAT